MTGDIEALFEKAISVSGVVGAQLSVFKDGEQLDLVHGLANAELAIPMTRDTVVQIGSVTKIFNAVMIMTLVEEGRLVLDEPVQRYVPEFAVSDSEATRTVTLRQLLSMSSGIDNGDYADYGSGEDAIARRVAALKAAPQHFPPGRYFGYSNASTDISGLVAERVTGRYWDDLLEERVIEPLGLQNAVSRDWERMFQRVSVGHVLDQKHETVRVIRRPRWSMPRGTAPMGGTLTASARDLVQLGKLFLREGLTASGARVLSGASIELMMTAQIPVPVHCTATSWCLGPCTYEWGGTSVWGHPGGNISGGSYLYWLPDKNGVMAWTINTVCAREPFEKVIARELMQAVFGIQAPQVVVPSAPIEIDPARYVGTYRAIDGECVVDMDGDSLVVTRRWRNFADPSVIDSDRFSLIPLSFDRFLIDRGPLAGASALPQDMAFFGDDSAGRATNVLNFVWALSRQSEAST